MRDRSGPRRFLLGGLAVVLTAVVVVGLVTAPPAPASRADALAARLRCPVCQSESVADSPSETARNMRERIDQLIAAGYTDEQIVGHFVDRYGQWVLLDPPLTRRTWLLWALPPAAMVAGTVVVMRLARRGRDRPGTLSANQRAAVAAARTELEAEEDGW